METITTNETVNNAKDTVIAFEEEGLPTEYFYGYDAEDLWGTDITKAQRYTEEEGKVVEADFRAKCDQVGKFYHARPFVSA